MISHSSTRLFPQLKCPWSRIMISDTESKARTYSIAGAYAMAYIAVKFVRTKKQQGNGTELSCNDIDKRRNNNLLKFQRALPPIQQQRPKKFAYENKDFLTCMCSDIFRLLLELFLLGLLPRSIDGNYLIFKCFYMAV